MKLSILIQGNQAVRSLAAKLAAISNQSVIIDGSSSGADIMVLTDVQNGADILSDLNLTKKVIIANLSDPKVREIMETYQKSKQNPHHPVIYDSSKNLISLSKPHWGADALLPLGLVLGIEPEKVRQILND